MFKTILILIVMVFTLIGCKPPLSGGPCAYESVSATCTVRQKTNEAVLCELSDKSVSSSKVFDRMDYYEIYGPKFDVAIRDELSLSFSAITSGTCTPVILIDMKMKNEISPSSN